MNGKPSKWGKSVVQTLELMECEDILELICRRHDPDEVQQRLDEGFEVLRVLEEKKTREMVESWTKEVWARLRCGSIDRCFKKGFKDWTCRICNSQQSNS
ncbi:hypothetical protein KQX54_004536 [Cotesia glomerata]|uniref:Uncharacterized protein n=1 Tax=Cotesia glomerata TaxID=32391 RepID=A0AAV7IBE4_COTGL|nr:hypothetical protein KQX54_004536 [Cotesia glomerata]